MCGEKVGSSVCGDGLKCVRWWALICMVVGMCVCVRESVCEYAHACVHGKGGHGFVCVRVCWAQQAEEVDKSAW